MWLMDLEFQRRPVSCLKMLPVGHFSFFAFPQSTPLKPPQCCSPSSREKHFSFEIKWPFVVKWSIFEHLPAGGRKVNSKNAPSFMTVVAVIFCIVASVAAGESLTELGPKIGGWAAAAYAVVAAIFVGIAIIIVVQIMSSLRDA
jgi:hypothetical protein